MNDLGLDSLDAVELVMGIEEEFALEIPDSEAEKIVSVADAINYIAAHPNAKVFFSALAFWCSRPSLSFSNTVRMFISVEE